MMGKRRYFTTLIFPCFLLGAVNYKAIGQQPNDYIKRNGYLIYFGIYGWFFQPCDDNTKPYYTSLNSASFSVRYGTDGYNNALRSFENEYFDKMETDTVFYWQPQKEGDYVGEIKYKYVEMVYKNRGSSIGGTQNIPCCTIELTQVKEGSKKYKLGCLWFDAIIDAIK